MRRRLIKHEQTVLPFVVDAQNIYPSELPMQAAPVPFACDGLESDANGQGVARIRLANQSITAHYQLTAVGIDISINGFFYRLQTATFQGKAGSVSASQELRSEIPGRIVKINISPGDIVEAGQVLILQEAMKTEMPLKATARSRVVEIFVAEGAQVEADTMLVKFEAAPAGGAEK